MNYLAHVFLSRHSSEMIIGGLLGDFVKGRVEGKYDLAVCQGIMLHRNIDRFTDAHEIVKAGQRLISPQRRRFAGIMMDVFFDHFLVRHWPRFSRRPLKEFTQHVYTILFQHYSGLPERLQCILPRMSNDDWLGSYGEICSVDAALNGIARRFSRYERARVLNDAVRELEENYTALEDHFLTFFPQLMQHVNKYIVAMSSHISDAEQKSEKTYQTRTACG